MWLVSMARGLTNMKHQYWADYSITAALGHAAFSGGRPHVIQEEQGRKQACAGSWLPREKGRKGLSILSFQTCQSNTPLHLPVIECLRGHGAAWPRGCPVTAPHTGTFTWMENQRGRGVSSLLPATASCRGGNAQTRKVGHCRTGEQLRTLNTWLHLARASPLSNLSPFTYSLFIVCKFVPQTWERSYKARNEQDHRSLWSSQPRRRQTWSGPPTSLSPLPVSFLYPRASVLSKTALPKFIYCGTYHHDHTTINRLENQCI